MNECGVMSRGMMMGVVQSCMKMGLCAVTETLDLLKCQAHLEINVASEKGSNHSTRRVEAG